MSTEQTRTRGGIGRFFAVLLRLTFVVIMAIILGVAAYWGIPRLYTNVITPIQNNISRVDTLEQRVTLLEEQTSQQNEELLDRIGSIELGIDALREELASLEGRITALEEQAQAQQEALQQLQENLTAQTETTEADLQTLDERVSTLEEAQRDLAARMAAPEAAIPSFERQLWLMTAWQQLLKARVHLLEENIGDARVAMRAARDALILVLSKSPEGEAETVQGLIERLDAIQADIESRPFLAAQRLDALWSEVEVLFRPPTQPTTEETQPSPPEEQPETQPGETGTPAEGQPTG